MIKKFTLQTIKKEQLADITAQVEKLIEEEKIEEGIAFIFVPHTTCGLLINENADPSVPKDIIVGLNKFLPSADVREFLHSEGNSPAHIKSSLTGQSQVLFIEKGKLALGTWQGIFLAEFDGPRKREVWIEIIKK